MFADGYDLPTNICPIYIELGGYTIVDALKHALHALCNPKAVVLSIQTLNVANYEDNVMDFVFLKLFNTLSIPREIEGLSGEEEEETEVLCLQSYHLGNLLFNGYILSNEPPETALSEGMMLFLGRLSQCTLEVFTQVFNLSSAHVVIENYRVDGLTFLGYPCTLWGTC